MKERRNIFITGGTGYIGRALIPRLTQRNHHVTVLVRKDSARKLPPLCTSVIGNPLDLVTFIDAVPPADTFIQLVGVAHPSPSKAGEFRSIDLISLKASVTAAVAADVRHFVYISVAHSSPVMQSYIDVRKECEQIIRESKLNATILRPWYVLGEGHRWPYLFVPFYWMLERIPSTRAAAQRLGLVTIHQFIETLLHSIEHPSSGIRIIEIPEIKQTRVS